MIAAPINVARTLISVCHTKPRLALVDGGSNFPSNLRAAHPHCNYAKNARRSSKLRDYAARSRPSRDWPGAIDLRAKP